MVEVGTRAQETEKSRQGHSRGGGLKPRSEVVGQIERKEAGLLGEAVCGIFTVEL